MRRIFLLALLLAGPLIADDEFTLYELLAPESHQFAITYDVTLAKEGAVFYVNPIRPGSVATNERVISLATGKALPFETVNGKVAMAQGLVAEKTLADARFIKVHLDAPVPKGGETRIRIIKTYTDAASYSIKDGALVFERPLGIKRNVVILPKGWELVECGSPGIVSTDADGRMRVSFLNDRDDQLPVRIAARKVQ